MTTTGTRNGQGTTPNGAGTRDYPPVALPVDCSLPLFVYGSFKPSELAFRQIERFVERSENVSIAGSISIRDGLPLFATQGDQRVKGYVLRFKLGMENRAYETIRQFEPAAIYQWGKLSLGSDNEPEPTNVLVGKDMSSGRAEPLETGDWSFQDDPVFKEGMRAVEEIANLLASGDFTYETFWPQFFQMQMAYLLLWSIIERFTTFAYGGVIGPNQRVAKFGDDERFKRAIKRYSGDLPSEVYNCMYPNNSRQVNREKPRNSAHHYYQVRSNLSHRGKGAWMDYKLLHTSLMSLFALFNDILVSTKTDAGGASLPQFR